MFDNVQVKNGARPDHPQVAIVLTDGESNEPQLTVIAALKVSPFCASLFVNFCRKWCQND